MVFHTRGSAGLRVDEAPTLWSRLGVVVGLTGLMGLLDVVEPLGSRLLHFAMTHPGLECQRPMFPGLDVTPWVTQVHRTAMLIFPVIFPPLERVSLVEILSQCPDMTFLFPCVFPPFFPPILPATDLCSLVNFEFAFFAAR